MMRGRPAVASTVCHGLAWLGSHCLGIGQTNLGCGAVTSTFLGEVDRSQVFATLRGHVSGMRV